mmetsp:Transcript_28012/g.66234  ORF Transcript_28012/g.66234 Transcript_28012/m.66234 type:complete len:244 (+) Transcript_28012:400-1131(+)
MSSKMRRRVSSSWPLPLPNISVAFTTSCRSVFAVIASQKIWRPPWTTGMEAKRVVFICQGALPELGDMPEPRAILSSAVTTRCTKTLFASELSSSGSQSMPSGMLNETNESGIVAGLTHMSASGAHDWSLSRESNTAFESASNTTFSELVGALYSRHASKSVSCVSSSSKSPPLLTRTESSGISSACGVPGNIGSYLLPIVNVTWTKCAGSTRLVRFVTEFMSLPLSPSASSALSTSTRRMLT